MNYLSSLHGFNMCCAPCTLLLHPFHVLYYFILCFFANWMASFFSFHQRNTTFSCSLSPPLSVTHTHTPLHKETNIYTHTDYFWTLYLGCILGKMPDHSRVNAAASPFLWEIGITKQLKYSCFTFLLTVLHMQST